MAWTYLVESEGSQLPWRRGCSLLPIVKLSDSLPLSFFQESQRENFQMLQSGTMLQPLEEICFQELTSSMEDSPARMSVRQDLEKAWMESEPSYTWKQFDLFENVNLSSYSSKMSKESENLCLTSGASLRRLVMIVGMDFSARQKSAQDSIAIDGGYWPTPLAQGAARDSQAERERDSPHLESYIKMRLGIPLEKKMSLNVCWIEWLMGYPIEHTELKDWAMQWFRSRQGRLSKS